MVTLGGFLRAQKARAEAGAAATLALTSVHMASASGGPAPLQAPCLFWASLLVSSSGPGGLRSPTTPVSRSSLPPSPPPQGAGCCLTSVTSSSGVSWPLTNKKTIFLSNSAMLRTAAARWAEATLSDPTGPGAQVLQRRPGWPGGHSPTLHSLPRDWEGDHPYQVHVPPRLGLNLVLGLPGKDTGGPAGHPSDQRRWTRWQKRAQSPAAASRTGAHEACQAPHWASLGENPATPLPPLGLCPECRARATHTTRVRVTGVEAAR